jgi:hypothetical protein
MKTEPTRLSGGLYLISAAGSIGLIAMGIFFILDNVAAAKLFGVPLQDGIGGTYVTVAAVRDLSVGLLALAFALLRDRRAMGLIVLLGAIIPIGDGLVVLRHSASPSEFLPLHWGGAAGCLIFAFLLLRRPRA